MKTINVAIIGGGLGCLAIMEMISRHQLRQLQMHLVGIADINPEAAGIKKARLSNIYTTFDYHDLFNVPNLDLIIELTGDPKLSLTIQREKPAHVQLMDHRMARLFWDFARLEDEKRDAEKEIEKRSQELQASEKEGLMQKKTAEGIIYGSPTPMFVIDKDHKITHWNKACEKLTGFSSGEMIGTNRQWEPFYDHKKPLLADVIIDNDPETIRKATKNMELHESPVVEGGYESEYFLPHLGPEGTYLYINAAPIKDNEGNIQGAIVAYQDFSERVKMTQAIKSSEEEARRQKKTAEGIIYGSPTPMFVIDKDHKITHWNKACEKLTGFSSEELIGTERQWEPFYPRKRPTLADLLIDGKIETIRSLYKDMNLRRSPMVEEAYEAEHFFPHLGPEGTHLYLNAAPIKDDAGNIQGAIITYQDFTDRVIMTQKIKRREAFVLNLIENSIDGIIATGPKGNIGIFNRGAAEILGYSPEEIIGKMTFPEILSEETGQAVRESFYSNQYGPQGKIINMEVNLLNKAKEPIPVRFSGTLLYEQEKEVGSVVFIQDLSQVHRLQKEKEQAQRMAAIGSTVAGVAHYIKNILAGLQGGAYVINSAISKKDLELVGKGWGMVERNIDQIGGIVTDMLIYSKERTPDYQMVDPNELVEEVLELIEEKARIAGVTLVRDLQSGKKKVTMDRTGIHNSLLNIIGNAIDSCTLEGVVDGKGIVTVKTDSPPGGGIRFIISDNGTGMDEKAQKRLFTDFFTTKGYKGTGLGLPVTKKIVEEHGGKLTFKSKLGQGTVFTLSIPRLSEPFD
ncbi:MAG: PAS domain S-box protein [Deltaproteobacteria bacterium]|nr:PAS domain S-box protein [Deltaproteobacteria bacterium]MBW1736368.1 PAS domain S-box protein [Deltaproteobacteria bacterium]MBW1909749.1 PAS domain S-box protein [Deltaproteobacteria bacterium]MBW2034009.1 PAS domain S-box protein [Deltaproteobacteria bacterium]MBW2113759.1 PAS domain S-box protein [Deltaproteobacteria bacterium]